MWKEKMKSQTRRKSFILFIHLPNGLLDSLQVGCVVWATQQKEIDKGG